MRLFRFIAQFFGESVYCEECIHCVAGDKYNKSQPMCKAHPITVDCSEKDTFVKRDRKIEIIKSYKPCKEVRLLKSMPLTYDDACWKFDKKPLTNDSDVV